MAKKKNKSFEAAGKSAFFSSSQSKKEKKTERIQLLISKTLDNKLKEAAANSK